MHGTFQKFHIPKKLFVVDSTFVAFLPAAVQCQAICLAGKIPHTNFYAFHHTKRCSHNFVTLLSLCCCFVSSTHFSPSQKNNLQGGKPATENDCSVICVLLWL